jgi:hypothetical protein
MNYNDLLKISLTVLQMHMLYLILKLIILLPKKPANKKSQSHISEHSSDLLVALIGSMKLYNNINNNWLSNIITVL